MCCKGMILVTQGCIRFKECRAEVFLILTWPMSVLDHGGARIAPGMSYGELSKLWSLFGYPNY